uniref:Uncharacterized protein n=1 Tax=Tanacetum cinerariifolium TaxID=118510 RepID=A0A6L2N896_TANCI|nr:hypothetical protein [Tanacetum cinerariifolium]
MSFEIQFQVMLPETEQTWRERGRKRESSSLNTNQICMISLEDEDVGLFVKALYENDSIIDLYCEDNGYDIMEMIQDQIAPKDQSVKPPFKFNADDYAHSTHENLEDLKDIVNFEVDGQTDDPTANLGGRFIHEENDPEDDIVDPKFKAKKNICYPSFDPSTSWNQCKPVVGMKFENPLQLKNMLAKYGVANGYQLWFMQNDYSKLLVYCGRDVGEGKCAAFKGKKPKDKHDHAECTNSDIGDSSSKPDHAECSSKPATKKNGRISQAMKESWSDKKEYEKRLETEDMDDGTIYFKRMYIFFKGIKQATRMRIYVKNKGRSKRIAKMQAKKFKFDANGTGSTADKAFDVSEDEE